MTLNLVERIKKQRWYTTEIERTIMAYYTLNTNDLENKAKFSNRVKDLKKEYQELFGKPYEHPDKEFMG